MKRLWLYRIAGQMARVLPRRAAYAIVRQAANWAYARNDAVRDALAANLGVVLESRGVAFSAEDLERLVRRNFFNFGKYVVDFFKVGGRDSESILEAVALENIDYLRQCRESGTGIIGVSAHLGNWELGSIVLVANGYRVNAVVLDQPTERLNALFQSRRIHRGVHVLPIRGAAASIPACLKRNEVVALLADLDFSGNERRVPFFGRPARLPRGPAVLAARCGTPILPAFVLRQTDDTFLFRAYPPILPDRSRSIEDTRKAIVSVMEEVIGAHPDQWFAFEKIWEDA